MTLRKLTYSQVKKAILGSLSADLLEPKYRALLMPEDPPEKGHCAVATEAFYHLAGGRLAGFMPVVCGYDVDTKGHMHFDAAKQKKDLRREAHWWLRASLDGARGKGKVLDITARQYARPFPYERGHSVGFMQPQQKPSKRAQIVVDRVTEKLGAKALLHFRQNNIRLFENAALKNKTTGNKPKARSYAP